MKSPWIEALRSVALSVPDLAAAETFYTHVWNLHVAARSSNVIYLQGAGSDHHLLALHDGAGQPATLRHVTLRARSRAALFEVAAAAVKSGGSLLQAAGAADSPAGGEAIKIIDPEGRCFEIVYGDLRVEQTTDNAQPAAADRPTRLAHVVLNAQAIATAQQFLESALGFKLADRTRIMAFMNCNADHHTLALGDTDNNALNHIAFLMPTLDAVMRGGGRMKDAGHPIEWGPGRHGPGNNAFNYFIDPFGVVIEYTAEVEQVDDSYQPGAPKDWTWPPGRVDQWGISQPPSNALKLAQRAVYFETAPE
jgi:catechol-2,3-dioxygenase